MTSLISHLTADASTLQQPSALQHHHLVALVSSLHEHIKTLSPDPYLSWECGVPTEYLCASVEIKENKCSLHYELQEKGPKNIIAIVTLTVEFDAN